MTAVRDTEPRLRRHSVTSADPCQELAGLNLDELRNYRKQLAAEEDKVSYWRRLSFARIDLFEAESGTEAHLTLEELVRVLGDTGTGRSRRALVRIKPADPLPELPELAEMWDYEVDAHDPLQVMRAKVKLREAERKLTEYRRALHELIDDATREIILRYRETPLAALSSIPAV